MSDFQVPDSHYPYIKESAFRDVFLPRFVKGDKEAFEHWIKDIAINMTAKVRVVEDHNVESVLFEVPPFTRGIGNSLELDVSSVYTHYERILQSGVGEKAGDRYLKEAIGDAIKPDAPHQDDMDAWQEILQRYGYDTAPQEKALVNDGLVSKEEDLF